MPYTEIYTIPIWHCKINKRRCAAKFLTSTLIRYARIKKVGSQRLKVEQVSCLAVLLPKSLATQGIVHRLHRFELLQAICVAH